MIILGNIIGYLKRRYRKINNEIRKTCGVHDVYQLISQRRREWKKHITKIGEDKNVVVTRKNTSTMSLPGRAPKRLADS